MTHRFQLNAFFAVGLLFYSLISYAQQQPAKAIVEGIVRIARTGEPLAGASVTLTSTASSIPTSPRANAVPEASTTTDPNGKFLLKDVEPGSYRLGVLKNGYVLNGNAFGLTAGEMKNDIAILMTQTATISGHVSSETGKPVPGISVQIQQRFYSANGTVSYSTIATAQTNDLGDYRAYWVNPGRYYISTAKGGGNFITLLGGDAGDFDNSVRRGMNNVSETYPQTFYPGVADISKASVVELDEGADIRGINISIPKPQKQYTIRGRVIDGSTGKAPAKAAISLPGSSAVRWWDGATGTFEIPNLLPGRYTITARLGDSSTFVASLLGNGSPGEPLGSVSVTVTDSDVENLVLRIGPPAVITGRLKLEAKLPDTTPVERLRITLVASSPGASNVSTAVSTDASFKMNAPLDGEFRVTVSSLPPGFYVKEARIDGINVLDVPSNLSTSGAMEILIGASSAQVTGRVLDQQSKPSEGVVVALIPSRRERFDLYKQGRTDSMGRFVFSGVVPGEYKAYSWQRIENNSYYDPDVLAKYEQQGTPVRVLETSNETLSLRLIPEAGAH